MGRKKILDSETAKFSVNVNGDNKRILDDLIQSYASKYSTMINKIIATYCNPPKEIQDDLEAIILKARKKALMEYRNTEDPIFIDDLEQKIQYYEDYLLLSHHGDYRFYDDAPQKPINEIKKIELTDGYLQIPTDWIVVNPEEIGKKSYAAVLECRNHAKYGIPHFVLLNDFKTNMDYTDAMKEEFFKRCTEKWPKFPEIMQQSEQNQLIEDPRHPGEFLNVDAYFAAPIIGIFAISDQAFGNHPYGAMIVRTSNNSREK